MDLFRRRLAPTALALLLAAGSVAAVSAASGALSPRSAVHPLPPEAPSAEVLSEVGSADRATAPVVTPTPAPAVAAPEASDDPAPHTAAPAPSATPTPTPTPRPTAKPKPAAPRVTVAPKPVATPKPAVSKPKAVTYSGRNHVWMPSLGVSQGVLFFPCDRSAPPDNYVYRWGCAGNNNVYLLGHASSVFRPLHDAYLNGRLKVGMRVIYANSSGVVHTFSVQWWKLVLPTGDVSWAWAAQSTPSMTLQTCMGANSQYRLIVRLVQIS